MAANWIKLDIRYCTVCFEKYATRLKVSFCGEIRAPWKCIVMLNIRMDFCRLQVASSGPAKASRVKKWNVFWY